MKYYLSSYKIGGEESIKEFKKLIPKNKKTAYISNALDFSNDKERRIKSEESDIEDLKTLNLEPEYLDLRKYFNKSEKLEKDIRKYGVIYVRGGNVFILRQAMELSGIDKILKKLALEKNDILYSGYSAGICVLSPSLKGLELVDNIMESPYLKEQKIIWEGLNLIDYMIVPHYQSNHSESELSNKIIEQYKKDGIKFKALRDGEAIVIK